MGKIIFFDIDGTLVSFHSGMQESAREALRAAKRNGHKIALCTGRSKMQIYPWLLEEGFDGIICGAGTYVECEGKTVKRHFMEHSLIQKSVSCLREKNATYGFQTADGIIFEPSQKERLYTIFHNMGVSTDRIDQICTGMRVLEGESFYSEVEKMFYYKASAPVSEVQKELAPNLDVTLASFDEPEEGSGEITIAGVTKATGMQEMLDYFGMSREDTVAFGDGPNDVEMLDFAKIGVAMGNAVEFLKPHAYMVTDDIDNDGVMHAMQKLGLV